KGDELHAVIRSDEIVELEEQATHHRNPPRPCVSSPRTPRAAPRERPTSRARGATTTPGYAAGGWISSEPPGRSEGADQKPAQNENRDHPGVTGQPEPAPRSEARPVRAEAVDRPFEVLEETPARHRVVRWWDGEAASCEGFGSLRVTSRHGQGDFAT